MLDMAKTTMNGLFVAVAVITKWVHFAKNRAIFLVSRIISYCLKQLSRFLGW